MMMKNRTFFSVFAALLIATLLISLGQTNAFAFPKMGIANFAMIKSSLPNFGMGPISSINKEWILSGHWIGFVNQTNPSDSGFFSIFRMVKADGTSPHFHVIYNGTATSINQQGNTTIIQGTASITMPGGPVNNVPTTWNILNGRVLTISMDPSKLNNHFGNTPIFGMVNTPGEGMQALETILSNPGILNDLSSFIGQGMMGEHMMGQGMMGGWK
ncbi:MAG: hypothetical protein ACTHME_02460 [Candidatus Nitrosocosmicus sp.]